MSYSKLLLGCVVAACSVLFAVVFSAVSAANHGLDWSWVRWIALASALALVAHVYHRVFDLGNRVRDLELHPPMSDGSLRRLQQDTIREALDEAACRADAEGSTPRCKLVTAAEMRAAVESGVRGVSSMQLCRMKTVLAELQRRLQERETPDDNGDVGVRIEFTLTTRMREHFAELGYSVEESTDPLIARRSVLRLRCKAVRD
jgi:hypothetical protein